MATCVAVVVLAFFAGEGGAAKEYKTSFHALASIVKKEGITGVYNG